MRKVVVIENATLDGFADSQEGLGFGHGTPLFHGKAKLDLELLESRAFNSGAVYVRYQVL